MPNERRSTSNLAQLVWDIAGYGLGSAAALILDVSILSLLTGVGVHYLVSAGVGFAAGLCFIYLISVKFVFRDRRYAAPRAEFLWFFIIGALGLALNEMVIFVCVAAAQFTLPEAKLVSACVVFLFNFFARRRLLFSGPPSDERIDVKQALVTASEV